MRINSAEIAQNYLSEWGIPVQTRAGEDSVKFLVPQDAGRKTALARLIAHGFVLEESILWVEQTDVFPSCENRLLFEKLREGYGATDSFHDLPVQVFDADEAEGLEQFAALALYYSWDFKVLCLDSRSVVSVDQDEYLSVSSASRMAELTAMFVGFHLERVLN